MDDLAIVITSLSEAQWLRRLLPTIAAHRGDIALDVVVADIHDPAYSDDGTAAMLAAEHPWVRVVPTDNGGFAHANNAAVATCDARYVLLLNPDTEVVRGSFAELVAMMDARPLVGIAGVRQLDADGGLYPTMRRFLRARRVLAEAGGSERLAPRLGHRVLDMPRYDRETSCDWTIGSFMLCRREALQSAGWMDERFFFYSEEEDLCWRVRDAGWDVRHLPQMTIVHHVSKAGVRPRFMAQRVYARHQLARKHFTPAGRAGYAVSQVLHDALRALPVGSGGDADLRREAAVAALRVTLGLDAPPFGAPPPTALPARA